MVSRELFYDVKIPISYGYSNSINRCSQSSDPFLEGFPWVPLPVFTSGFKWSLIFSNAASSPGGGV